MRALFYALVLSIPVETILYFRSDANDPDSTVSISRVLAILVLGLAVAKRKEYLRRFPLAFWLLVGYLGVYTLSQLWIPAGMDAKFHLQQLRLIQMIGLFLVSANVLADPEYRPKVLRLYGWTMAIVAAAMIAGVLDLQFEAEGRDTIVAQDPNTVACLFGLAALCLAGDPKLLAKRRPAALVAATVPAVALLIVGIMRTGSRGGLLAFAAGFLALAVCGGANTRAAKAAAVFVVLAMLGGVLQYEFANHTTSAERLERTWYEGDTAGRTDIYDTAWTMIQERPLAGYGGANSNFVLGAHLNYPDRDAHNVFMSVLIDVGLLGGVPFFLAMLYGLVNGWRGGKRTGEAVPFALMCCVLVMSNSIGLYREKIFWIVLGAAVAAGLKARPPSAIGARA